MGAVGNTQNNELTGGLGSRVESEKSCLAHFCTSSVVGSESNVLYNVFRFGNLKLRPGGLN